MGELDAQVVCPNCGSAFEVPRVRAGRRESCPVCGGEVLVPEPEAEPPAWEDEPLAEAAPVRDVQAPASAVCIVCASNDERPNILALRPVLREHTGLTHAEASMQIARGMGVIAEVVLANDAEVMVAELRSAGVPAFAVPANRVPEVQKELPKIRVYGASAGGLDVQTDAAGTIRSVPWSAIAAGFCSKLRAAPRSPPSGGGDGPFGAVLVPPIYMPGMAGLGIAMHRALSGPSPRPRTPAREHDVELTLLLRGRSGAISSLKVGEHQVRYSYLGQRLKPSSAQNFPVFLREVMQRSAGAFYPARTVRVAKGDLRGIVLLKGEGEYLNYRKWVLCCMTARTWGA